jgi:hypothetical protein
MICLKIKDFIIVRIIYKLQYNDFRENIRKEILLFRNGLGIEKLIIVG